MSVEEIIKELEEIMDVEEGSLKQESVLEEIDEWDSLSKLSLSVFAKKRLGISLTTEKISSFVAVKDICDVLTNDR